MRLSTVAGLLAVFAAAFAFGALRPADPAETAAEPAAQPNKPAPAAAANNQSGVYRMKKAVVMDEHGFARPIPAMTLLIPTDWQFQGGAQWGQFSGCTTSRVQTSFKSGTADGQLAVELYPAYYWQWSDDPSTQQFMQRANQQKAQVQAKPCDIMQPMSAADFVRRYTVPKLRPGKQIVAVEPWPEVLQEVQQSARETEASWARTTTPQQVRSDVARARLQYSLNGKPVEEWIAVIVTCNARVLPTYNIRSGQGKATRYDCSAYSMFALRAPQGELTARQNFFRMIAKTIRFDPNWQAQVNGVASNIAKVEQKGVADRAAIQAKSAQDIAKIQNEGYAEREKIKDASAASYTQTLRDLETYKNPNTGETVELSSLYGHAWTNDKGEYLLVDHAGFDPNLVFKDSSWTAMVQVKK